MSEFNTMTGRAPSSPEMQHNLPRTMKFDRDVVFHTDFAETERRVLAQYARQCGTCPFAGSDAVEQAINLGCVPGVGDIMQIKREKGLNWGCHSAEDGEKRVCGGFVVECIRQGLPLDGKLLPYNDWYHQGVPEEGDK